MRVKFSCNIVDLERNTSSSNQITKDIDVSSKCRVKIYDFWFSKDGVLNRSIFPDGSLRIVWQVEYFDNFLGIKALPSVEIDFDYREERS